MGVSRDLKGMAAVLRRFELDPTDDAPASGRYELLNIFGTPTSEAVSASEGERLPAAPLGYTWRLIAVDEPLEVARRRVLEAEKRVARQESLVEEMELGRSVLHVASAMAEMDAAGVALYSDQQAIDSTSPFGKAMMQMACVFGELEREMIRARVVAGLNRVREQGIKKLGRPQVGRGIEESIRRQLGAGHGILKVARMVGCGSGTVQRVKREMVATMAEAA
jgi:Resolvase, N terminal domain